MSDRYFDKSPSILWQMADDVDDLILHNRDNDAHAFSTETMERFVQCRDTLRKAYSLFRRIDRLMNGADSELTFRVRLEEELANLEKRK